MSRADGGPAVSGQMEAGRELDALIEERVMGLPGAHIGGWDDPRELPDGRVLPGLNPRPFSSDIAAAWEVVERMESQGYRFCIWTHAVECWPADGSSPARAEGQAPLAICLAALKAVDREPPAPR